jgi:hypothetical protein
MWVCSPFSQSLGYGAESVNRGGKVAMTAALSPELPPETVSNLIVVDIAPSRATSLSDEFTGYFEGMQRIEDTNVSTREDAQIILTEYEAVRQSVPAAICHANPPPRIV